MHPQSDWKKHKIDSIKTNCFTNVWLGWNLESFFCNKDFINPRSDHLGGSKSILENVFKEIPDRWENLSGQKKIWNNHNKQNRRREWKNAWISIYLQSQNYALPFSTSKKCHRYRAIKKTYFHLIIVSGQRDFHIIIKQQHFIWAAVSTSSWGWWEWGERFHTLIEQPTSCLLLKHHLFHSFFVAKLIIHVKDFSVKFMPDRIWRTTTAIMLQMIWMCRPKINTSIAFNDVC